MRYLFLVLFLTACAQEKENENDDTMIVDGCKRRISTCYSNDGRNCVDSCGRNYTEGWCYETETPNYFRAIFTPAVEKYEEIVEINKCTWLMTSHGWMQVAPQ